MGFHLRADLGLVRDEDGALVALDDPAYGRRIDLGPTTAALAAGLDGRDTEVLLASFGERERAARALRRFLLLGLVEEASPEVTRRLRALRSGEARLAPTVLAGARFGCQGSGECCLGHRLGPLADEDVARLETLGHPDAVVELPRDDGSPGRYLRQVDGRCGFLEDDRRCGLHRRHGPTAKPGFCRLYPLELSATLDGLKLFDRGSCASFARSTRAGLTLAEQAPELLALPGAIPPLHHPVVRVSDRLLVDHAHWLAFARAGIALVAGRPAGLAVAALGRRLAALAAALEALPLDAGEPERTRDAILASGFGFVPAPPGVAADGAELLGVVLADLEEHAAGASVRAAFGGRLADGMHAVLGAARRRALAAAEGEVPAIDADLDELLGRSLAQRLFSTRALIADRPWAGLLGIAVLLACAAAAGDPSQGHSLAARFLELGGAAAVLVQHEELAPEALEGMVKVLSSAR